MLIGVVVAAYGLIKFQKMSGRLDTNFQQYAESLIMEPDSE